MVLGTVSHGRGSAITSQSKARCKSDRPGHPLHCPKEEMRAREGMGFTKGTQDLNLGLSLEPQGSCSLPLRRGRRNS